jgi:hypothetical protein
VSPSVVGTTYLALTDIARMKATKTNSEEGDIVTLPLHRRSGRTQGSIRLSVNLAGATIQQMMYALGKSYHLEALVLHGGSCAMEGMVLSDRLGLTDFNRQPFWCHRQGS